MSRRFATGTAFAWSTICAAAMVTWLSPRESWGLFPLILMVCGLVTLTLAIPVFLILAHFNRVCWWTVIPASVLLSTSVSLVFGNDATLPSLAAAAGIGLVAAVVFLAVHRFGNALATDAAPTKG